MDKINARLVGAEFAKSRFAGRFGRLLRYIDRHFVLRRGVNLLAAAHRRRSCRSLAARNQRKLGDKQNGDE